MVFFLFANILQITFFPADTWKREWLDNSLLLKNPDVAESWISAHTIYHYPLFPGLQIPLLAVPHTADYSPEYTPP